MKKQLTALFLQTEFDLSEYLKPVIGIAPSSDLSVESQGKYFQFRNVGEKINGEIENIEAKDDLYGRLCQIRVRGKPDQATPDNPEEKEIEGGVIEAAGFRYNKETRFLLIQQNHHVSTSPKSIFIKLLRLINKNVHEPERGFTIIEKPRKDVLDELRKNKEGVRKMKIDLSDADLYDLLASRDDYLGCCFNEKDAIEHVAVHITFAMNSPAKERAIEQIVECENEEEGTAFYVKGQSPLVISSKYIRKELVYYPISEDASREEKRQAIYKALAKIDVSNIY